MKVGCIIQARMTSSRLPGKVMRIIDFQQQETILGNVIDRVKMVKELDGIVVATTVNDNMRRWGIT